MKNVLNARQGPSTHLRQSIQCKEKHPPSLACETGKKGEPNIRKSAEQAQLR